MNTAGITRLGAKAKPTAEAIAKWCEREGVGYEFLPPRGGHPSVRLSLNRQSRKVFFSATPSDMRVIENVLQSVRKEARVMGWKPRKEAPMETVAKTLSDIPKLVNQGAPVIRRYEHPKSDIPKPPNVDRRNEWIFDQMIAGGDHHEVADKLSTAGWDLKPQSVYAQYRKTRLEKGYEPALKMQKRGNEKSEPSKPAHVSSPAVSSETIHDPLVIAIAEAIAPLLRDQIRSLKVKADKWDAIAGLVKDA